MVGYLCEMGLEDEQRPQGPMGGRGHLLLTILKSNHPYISHAPGDTLIKLILQVKAGSVEE